MWLTVSGDPVHGYKPQGRSIMAKWCVGTKMLSSWQTQSRAGKQCQGGRGQGGYIDPRGHVFMSHPDTSRSLCHQNPWQIPQSIKLIVHPNHHVDDGLCFIERSRDGAAGRNPPVGWPSEVRWLQTKQSLHRKQEEEEQCHPW